MAEDRPRWRVAVLIDCDNINASMIRTVLAEAAVHGLLTVKRAYGDWTSSRLKAWRKELAPHGLQPVQQFAHAPRKNATDMALVIDAMDLLYAGTVDVFCIVSSDSDFTRLAMRLRESGRRVYGLGDERAVEAFRRACDRFTDLAVAAAAGADGPLDRPASVEAIDRSAIDAAVRASAGDDGWAPLSTVGQFLVSNDPTFDSRNHGYAKLSQLVRAVQGLEVDEQTMPSGMLNIRVRLADRRAGRAAARKG